MANSKNDQFVIAFFETFRLADEAARQIENWEKGLIDVQFGSIGVIEKSRDGKIKTHSYGPRYTRKGAKTGMLLGVLAALMPAVSLAGGLASGAILGGAVGRLSKKKLGLAEDDLERIQEKLDNRNAVLVMACDDYEVKATEAELANLGGEVEVHEFYCQDLEDLAKELSI